LAWTIEYTEAARTQLRKLDKAVACRILDYMDQRIAQLEDARSMGKRYVDLWESFGVIGKVNTASFVNFMIRRCAFWWCG
jgi:hypothetical protein